MNNQPPKTWQEEQEEIDEWVEERRESAQDDYDELIDDLIDLQRDTDPISEIAASYDEAWH